MLDIIQLLPDSIANQIAAGEVIQRPASAIKELLENSVDAGSTNIKVIIKEAGKSLMQVIDNGCGMSERDARLCFERHATSKIKTADDLFCIRTKGFRGEALASIAAIAQVEMKTRRTEDEIGTQIIIEGAKFMDQQSCATPAGTSFAVKNLFFNVPARRNFLKSNPAETRHILEEFQRVALAHSSIAFSLHHDGNEIFNLSSGNLRQRIMGVFGNNYNERLVPVEEETTIIKLNGYIVKPEFAKKTRGEQYFFVNNRFIRDAYLNHAVNAAFEELLPKDCFAGYFLFIEIDPSRIDINIHPTKTEIKFDDERSIYQIIRATVKRSLGKFSIAPSLDFEQEPAFNISLQKMKEIPNEPVIKINPLYNPFEVSKEQKKNIPSFESPAKKNAGNWEKLYEGLKNNPVESIQQKIKTEENGLSEFSYEINHIQQLQSRFIIAHYNSGFYIIDQQAAHERILFEKNIEALNSQSASSQQDLFPQSFEFSPPDALILHELLPDLLSMGLDIAEFGKNTFVVNGIPTYLDRTTIKPLLEKLVEQYKHYASEFKSDRKEKLALSMARQACLKAGTALSEKEIKQLIRDLFQTSNPFYSYSGKPIVVNIGLDEIEKRFNK